MTSEYRLICDICGKETRGFCDNKSTDEDVAKQNWDIRIDAMWFEAVKDANLLKMKEKTEVSWDACVDCAVEAAKVLREWASKNADS